LIKSVKIFSDQTPCGRLQDKRNKTTSACPLGASMLEVEVDGTNSKVKSQWLKKEMKEDKLSRDPGRRGLVGLVTFQQR